LTSSENFSQACPTCQISNSMRPQMYSTHGRLSGGNSTSTGLNRLGLEAGVGKVQSCWCFVMGKQRFF